MKKAEEIAVEVGLFKSIEAVKENFGLQITRDCYIGTSNRIIRAIKQAQIDAIDETVKRCAQQALLSIDGIVEKSNGQTYLCDEGNHYTETWINIDKQSILQVAEELKKELE